LRIGQRDGIAVGAGTGKSVEARERCGCFGVIASDGGIAVSGSGAVGMNIMEGESVGGAASGDEQLVVGMGTDSGVPVGLCARQGENGVAAAAEVRKREIRGLARLLGEDGSANGERD
jgi:hypothetical protein